MYECWSRCSYRLSQAVSFWILFVFFNALLFCTSNIWVKFVINDDDRLRIHTTKGWQICVYLIKIYSYRECTNSIKFRKVFLGNMKHQIWTFHVTLKVSTCEKQCLVAWDVKKSYFCWLIVIDLQKTQNFWEKMNFWVIVNVFNKLRVS